MYELGGNLAKEQSESILFRIAFAFAALMIFTSPLQEISYYWKFSITGYRIFLVLALLSVCAALWRRQLMLLRTSLAWPMVFLLLAGFLSMFKALSLAQSLRMEFVLIVSFLGYFVVVWLSTDEKWLLRLINAYVITALVSAAYGFFQLVALKAGIESMPAFLKSMPVVNPVLRAPLYERFLIGTRIDAFLGDPNFLSGFMVASLFLTVALGVYYLRLNKNRLSWLYLLATVILFVAFLLAYSRSGLLGFLMAALAFLVWGYHQIKGKLVLRFASLALAILLILLVISLPAGRTSYVLDKAKVVLIYNLERFFQPFGMELSSTVSHLSLGRVGIEMFAKSPLLGFGIGNYGQYYGRYVVKGQTTEGSHSSYVQFFAETGVLGGLAFLWIIVTFLLTLFQRFRQLADKDPRSSLILGVFAGSIGYFAANIFYNYITHEYVWLYLGLGVACTRALRNNR